MFGKRRLVWQLLPTYLLLGVGILFGVSAYFNHVLRDQFETQQSRHLHAYLSLIRAYLDLEHVPWHDLDQGPAVRQLAEIVEARITLVEPDGRVSADSEQSPDVMDNHLARQEIREASEGKIGVASRFSRTLQQDMLYVAMRVPRADGTYGYLRLASSLAPLAAEITRIRFVLIAIASVAALAAFLVSLMVARHLRRQLEGLREGADRFADGDMERRVPLSKSFEIARLTDSINRMAAQLDQRIHAVVEQRQEMEAVFSSMSEGVLAVDVDERILRLNQAAGRLLEVNPERAQGRTIHDVIRNTALESLIEKALEGVEPVEGQVTLYQRGEMIMQVHGGVLRDAQGQGIGAVLVLNDVTRLRRLEQVRRDFVANVSHELRTPITSIKGFVETLLEGALDDREDAQRFLEIVAKQAERLNSIVEDLLTLSRIEQGEEKAEVVLAPGSVYELIQGAIQCCKQRIAEKGVHIEVTCPDELAAAMNLPLLEQALTNLIDNAVKYSDPGAIVSVQGEQTDKAIVLRVIDHGVGIEPEHIPRLFERFYRVDKSRSRDLGGTGLGLSIVKHIVNVHRGEIRVESIPGRGSTFTISLPRVISVQS